MSPKNSSSNVDAYSITRLFSLRGKVSIVSGASGGLGGNIALALSSCGSAVALAGRNVEKLTSVKRKIEEGGAHVSTHIMNVLMEKKVERMAKEVYQEYGRIDVLVNAHGVNYRIPTREYPVERWEEVVGTNLRGTFITCKAVGKYMVAQGAGKIVNLSSTAAGSGYEWGYSAYSPSKGGVDSLTRTLAVEWGKYGINVNSVAPYLVYTELTRKFLSKAKVYRKAVGAVPMGRLGYPRDVVGAVIFFASPASDWVNGQVLYVDGGYMAH